MEHNEIEIIAKTLDDAALEGREIERVSQAHPSLDLPAAYEVQDALIARRYARGEKYLGLKMGFTSEAKREQMGLHSPIYGVLTDRMRVDQVFRLKGSIHPKIEPEIAFRIGRDLRGKLTRDEALAGCSSVFAAMEVLDSRYTGFKYFSLPDVVADNCSSSHFVMSSKELDPKSLDLKALRMEMSANGKLAQTAFSSAISGDPVLSIVQLCELLHERGLALKAGSIVLAGAATQAIPLEAGMHVQLQVEGLGSVSVRAEA